MSIVASLDSITEAGLCIGCGLCRSVLGKDAVGASTDSAGRTVPFSRRPLTEPELKTLNAICPGIQIGIPAPAQDAAHDTMWGNIRALSKGYAADPDIRFKASSGGVLTALSLLLLETGKVDFIVHIAADPTSPMRSRAHRSYTRADVLEAMGSRYAPTAPLENIAAILDEGRPFAFVGKPCDVTGLFNLARIDPRVDALCRFRLALVCGGVSEISKTLDLLSDWAISEDELARFSWRGDGCPGPTAATTNDGRRFEITYPELWRDEAKWRILFRCKVCPDPIGLSADLCALDCWDGGGPQREDEGFNAIVPRTIAGVLLYEEAIAKGYLTVAEPLATADLDRFQPHQTRKRKAIFARLAGMAEAGGPYPTLVDPELQSVSLVPGSPDYEREKVGTTRRLHDRADA